MLRRLVAGASMVGAGYWLWQYLSPQYSTLVLDDSVVIVTGASSGLGEALAEAFARRGAKIVLAARRIDRLESVAQRITPYAAEVLIVPTDLTAADGAQQLVTKTLDHFGRIDVLVNNAGISGGDHYDALDPAFIERTLALNLSAPLQLIRFALPHMRQRNSGFIVNVGSGMGWQATPYFSAYTASKAGLSAFSRALRRELLGTNIRVMYAALGWIRTEMVPPEQEAVLRQFPQHSILSAETVAEQIIEALVQGRYEVVTGNWIEQIGSRSDRFVPRLVDIYWRFVLRWMPWIDVARKTG